MTVIHLCQPKPGAVLKRGSRWEFTENAGVVLKGYANRVHGGRLGPGDKLKAPFTPCDCFAQLEQGQDPDERLKAPSAFDCRQQEEQA